MKDSCILVICGGFSEEREVSLRSGSNVFKALQRLGYTQAELFDLDSKDKLRELASKQVDLAILMTHGKFGEDGCLQGYLELLGIPYTGSGVQASANCMDKVLTKQILRASQKDYPHLAKAGISKSYIDLKQAQKEIPAIEAVMLKASGEGSSVGISKYNSIDEIDTIPEGFFVERFIRGKEITASIIPSEIASTLPGNNNKNHCQRSAAVSLQVLPLLELRPKNEFYDYEAKYTTGLTDFILPAEISEELSENIKAIALDAYRAMGCKGFARVDFIIEDKSELPYILEINTLPGMTDTSDLPAQAQAAGISYDQLVEILCCQ